MKKSGKSVGSGGSSAISSWILSQSFSGSSKNVYALT